MFIFNILRILSLMLDIYDIILIIIVIIKDHVGSPPPCPHGSFVALDLYHFDRFKISLIIFNLLFDLLQFLDDISIGFSFYDINNNNNKYHVGSPPMDSLLE